MSRQVTRQVRHTNSAGPLLSPGPAAVSAPHRKRAGNPWGVPSGAMKGVNVVSAARKGNRPNRGVRFSDAEWALAAARAAAVGKSLGQYLRDVACGPTGPASALAADCVHEVVLVVPELTVMLRELCQCRQCGRIGAALP